MHQQVEGFSLLELMLVLALLALVSAVILPNLFVSDGQRLQDEVRRLQQVLHLASRETRMSGVPIRWTAYEDAYRFEQRGRDRTWHLLQEKPFQEHVLAAEVRLNDVQIQGESAFIPMTEEATPDPSTQYDKDVEPRLILAHIVLMPDGALSLADIQLITEHEERWLEVRPGMAGIHERAQE